jgi:peptide/nickel transport system substrate-binding protein
MTDRTPGKQHREAKITRRALGLYGTAAALAGLIPGVATAAASPAGSRADRSSAFQDHPRGGSLTVANAGDAVTLDPAFDIGYSFHITPHLYDTLVGFTEKLGYEGILAESWDVSQDGLEYTFHLRSGISFHDGTEFNADAVKFTFDRIIDPQTKAVSIGWIDALKETVVVDPRTVKLVLKQPFSPLLSNLTVGSFGIVSPTAVQNLGADFGRTPVGTGPFKFKDWTPGESVTIERNDNWRNFHTYIENPGPVYLDQLVFRNIPEADTQLAALQSGEVDVIDLPPREVQSFKDDGQYQVFLAPDALIQYVEFSMVKPAEGQYLAEFKPPFDDLRVRQAVGHAIDADTIIKSVLFGLATRDYGPISTRLFAYKPEIEQYGYHYDPAKAKSLLDQAGWVVGADGVREKGGAKLNVVFSTSSESTAEKVGQVLQNQLQQVGFGVKLQSIESASFISSLDNNGSNLDFAQCSWVDPHLLAMVAGLTDWQFGRFHDEQYLSLLKQGAIETDLAKRTEIYFEASKIVLADAAMIPLWTPLTPRGVAAKVKGYKFAPPRGLPTYEDVYVEG